MTRRPIGMVVANTACALTACSVLAWSSVSEDSMSAAAESAPITIGALLPLTGEAAHWGIPPRKAAEMAVDEINRAGGIGGRRLALMIEDDRCQPPDGIAAFHKIMATANPAVFLGAVCSGGTLAGAPPAQARRPVLISP